MIKIYKKALEGARRFGFWDWTILKLYLVIVGIFLATIIPSLTGMQWRIYLIIIVVLGTYLCVKIFKKRK